MGMSPETGKIRSLKGSSLAPTEVLFTVGEEVEIRGCAFKVHAVATDPTNEVTLKGIPAPQGGQNKAPEEAQVGADKEVAPEAAGEANKEAAGEGSEKEASKDGADKET